MSQVYVGNGSGGGGGSGIVTIDGNTGSITGTTVTINGGTTGLTTTGSGSTMNLGGTLSVANGGTGDASLTAYAVLCGGTTSTGAVQSIASVGTSGQVLTSNGASALPTFQTASTGVTGPGSSTNNAVATWNGTGGTALLSPPTPLITSGGVMTNSNQPCFLAVLSTTQTDVTGDGTLYPIVFDIVVTNQGSGYNNSTGNFTAPIAGNYIYNLVVVMGSLPAAGTQMFCQIRTSTTEGVYTVSFGNPVPVADPSTGFFQVNGTVLIPMTASSTAHATVLIAGGTKTASVVGGNPNPSTYFSGALIC